MRPLCRGCLVSSGECLPRTPSSMHCIVSSFVFSRFVSRPVLEMQVAITSGQHNVRTGFHFMLLFPSPSLFLFSVSSFLLHSLFYLILPVSLSLVIVPGLILTFCPFSVHFGCISSLLFSPCMQTTPVENTRCGASVLRCCPSSFTHTIRTANPYIE